VTPQPFEIWFVRVKLGHSRDARPAIVIGKSGNKFAVVPLSSALALRQYRDFSIRPSGPEFKSTGLNRESFAIENELAEIDASDFVKKLGVLLGSILARFKSWYGL
jgi:hypothetical protein